VSDKNIEQQKIAASVRLSVRSNSLYIVSWATDPIHDLSSDFF
jgi:hypothetical protein